MDLNPIEPGFLSSHCRIGQTLDDPVDFVPGDLARPYAEGGLENG
jgi:hypothetical protein